VVWVTVEGYDSSKDYWKRLSDDTIIDDGRYDGIYMEDQLGNDFRIKTFGEDMSKEEQIAYILGITEFNSNEREEMNNQIFSDSKLDLETKEILMSKLNLSNTPEAQEITNKLITGQNLDMNEKLTLSGLISEYDSNSEVVCTIAGMLDSDNGIQMSLDSAINSLPPALKEGLSGRNIDLEKRIGAFGILDSYNPTEESFNDIMAASFYAGDQTGFYLDLTLLEMDRPYNSTTEGRRIVNRKEAADVQEDHYANLGFIEGAFVYSTLNSLGLTQMPEEMNTYDKDPLDGAETGGVNTAGYINNTAFKADYNADVRARNRRRSPNKYTTRMVDNSAYVSTSADVLSAVSDLLIGGIQSRYNYTAIHSFESCNGVPFFTMTSKEPFTYDTNVLDSIYAQMKGRNILDYRAMEEGWQKNWTRRYYNVYGGWEIELD